ncbi:macro domain-containing protein [Bacteroides fluxus]|uniref:macro domain-containing protein n=1 Tax=Bacteroides fluxus TaxID=626930 RepID=UPI00235295F9|nr:macro domain-containing protein [Bacteroides fluxus]
MIDDMFSSVKTFVVNNYCFFLKQVALAMGTFSCVLTIVIGIWPQYNCSCMWGCCLFASVAWGISSIIPSNEIDIEFIRMRVIHVKVGDLFDTERGSIVIIPVNNYLDTQLEHDVIGPHTVHGLFIQHYRDKYPGKNLDNEINNAIARDGILSSGSVPLRRNVSGKLDKYPLGTIVRLFEEDKQYYLVVATEFDENNHVIYQPEKFTSMLLSMMGKINTYNSGHPVYMPIIGSGQTGLNLSKQKTLCHILQCFNLADHYVTTGGTTILLHKKDKKYVALNKVKYEFNNIE